MKATVIASFVVFSIIYSVNGQSTTAEPPKKKNFLYNATTSLLSLTRDLPMTISVYEVNSKTEDGNVVLSKGKFLASADFPDADKVQCSISALVSE